MHPTGGGNVEAEHMKRDDVWIHRPTRERLLVFAPVAFADDFIGAGAVVIPAAGSPESSTPGVKKIVGAGPPTVAGIANAVNGRVRCALEVTSEKQDAALYHNDQRNWTLGQGLEIECGITISTLPTGSGRIVFGLAGTWADGPDAMARSIWFQLKPGGTLFAEVDDDVTDTSADTGIRITAGEDALFGINCRDLANIRFTKNGTSVTPEGTRFVYTGSGANAQMQPYFSVYKATGTGVGAVDIDFAKLWQRRENFIAPGGM